MSAWAAKRFWKTTSAQACDGGFGVMLDGRAVKTPAKTLLVVPTLAMARAVAGEWDAQTGLVNPETMPVTRAANSALDKVAVQFDEVARSLSAYGETDLLCYRATGPQALVARQAEGWDPLLDWAARDLGAPLRVTSGVVPIDQPADSIARLAALVRGYTPFELAAVHDMIAIPGSLVLGLAIARGRLTAGQAWDLSRIDESWQAEQWGIDEDAADLAALKQEALEQAARFFALCR